MGQPAVETRKTLFGYGKPKAVASPQRSQAPAQVSFLAAAFPKQLTQVPAVYDGSRLLVYKLLPASLPLGARVTITAATPEGDLSLEVVMDRDSFIEGNSLHQLYARKAVQDLEESNNSHNSNSLFGGFGAGTSDEAKNQITALGLKYQIATK